MRVKLTRLRLVTAPLKEEKEELEGEIEDGHLVRVNRRFRFNSGGLKPGQSRVIASLVVTDDSDDDDDCGCAFNRWLDELPDGAYLGSEFDVEFKPVKR